MRRRAREGSGSGRWKRRIWRGGRGEYGKVEGEGEESVQSRVVTFEMELSIRVRIMREADYFYSALTLVLKS